MIMLTTLWKLLKESLLFCQFSIFHPNAVEIDILIFFYQFYTIFLHHLVLNF